MVPLKEKKSEQKRAGRQTRLHITDGFLRCTNLDEATLATITVVNNGLSKVVKRSDHGRGGW